MVPFLPFAKTTSYSSPRKVWWSGAQPRYLGIREVCSSHDWTCRSVKNSSVDGWVQRILYYKYLVCWGILQNPLCEPFWTNIIRWDRGMWMSQMTHECREKNVIFMCRMGSLASGESIQTTEVAPGIWIPVWSRDGHWNIHFGLMFIHGQVI